MAAVFVSSLGLLVYHFILYPILLFAATLNKSRRDPQLIASGEYPTVELIVPAHNEQGVIADKVRNIRALDYPNGKLTAIIALDGCSDGTEQVLANVMAERDPENDNLKVVVYRQNIGKVAVLNELIAQSTAEIIALSDTSALLDANALKQAGLYFCDRRVGVVCAAYKMSAQSSFAERAYWTYQAYIKELESLFGSVIGAHGAFYLFRRSLWTTLPSDTINDDFVLPMKIVAAGGRAVYASEIGVEELEVSRPAQEIRRRVRLGAGNIQQLAMLFELADPRRGRVAFMFISGKALRSIVPYAFVMGCVSGIVWIAEWEPILAILMAGACGVVLSLPVLAPGAWGIVGVVGYVALSSIASAFGGLLYLLGPKGAAWKVSRRGKQL